MNSFKYITIRLAFLVIAYVFFWNIAYYALPKYMQEDQFSFIGEVDVFFRISFVFTILFLIFLAIEIYKFNKTTQFKLRNTAIILGMFSLIIAIGLFYLNRIY